MSLQGKRGLHAPASAVLAAEWALAAATETTALGFKPVCTAVDIHTAVEKEDNETHSSVADARSQRELGMHNIRFTLSMS